eukprot:8151587-Karenia_brevis.AAC.1
MGRGVTAFSLGQGVAASSLVGIQGSRDADKGKDNKKKVDKARKAERKRKRNRKMERKRTCKQPVIPST